MFAGCTDHFVGFAMRHLIWRKNVCIHYVDDAKNYEVCSNISKIYPVIAAEHGFLNERSPNPLGGVKTLVCL